LQACFYQDIDIFYLIISIEMVMLQK